MIAFTADNHLGITSQWSIKERGTDFLSAFGSVIDKVLEVDGRYHALIIGGDLFDSPYPPSFAVEFVQNMVRKLLEKHVYVYGIDGNHDVADCKWLRVCGIAPLSETPVAVAPKVTACGISYKRPQEVIDTVRAMADAGTKCDILVLHLAFGELNRMGAASDVSAQDLLPSLKRMGVKTVLMGHIHIRQSVKIDGIEFAYPGSTESCSMNEPRGKGFLMVNCDDLAIAGYEPIHVRKIVTTVVSTEDELVAFESWLDADSDSLHAVFVTPDIKDGVKRLRAMAKAHGVMMRIQVMRPDSASSDPEAIDRSTGVIGLEQAIELSFSPDSDEAGLVRSILRAPEALKATVENYMNPKEEK